MDSLTLKPGLIVGYQDGMTLVYDKTLKKATWKHPVDAREGLIASVHPESGETIEAALTEHIPEGTKIPPHPAPWTKSPGPVLPAVSEAAGTIAATAPPSTMGATSPGPKVTRSTGGPTVARDDSAS